jgi:HAE1 family hydrophobic/amphiphilic exporter-1
VAIILLVVFILGFGIYCTGNMAINLLPDINVPMVCVQVIYPGASAASVESDVTEKLEDGLTAIAGVTDVDSYSYDNLSAVVLSFDYGTDTKEKKSDISTKLNSITLPDGCTTSVYEIDLNSQALAVLSVTGKESADDTLAKAEKLKSSLTSIDGVESVEILGGGDKIIKITPYVGTELISLLLVQTLSYGSLDIPLGNLTVDGAEVQVRNNSDVSSVEDIKNSPVNIPSSFVTLLASVNQVMDYYEDSTTEDLIALRDDLADGVQQVLADLDKMSYDEVNKLAVLKTYMNIASTYTADQLTTFKTSRYYSEIYKRVEGKTDDELADIADDINEQYPNLSFTISPDLLKVVRDGRLDDIITYRTWLESTDDYRAKNKENEYYELTDDDYLVLARSQTLDVRTFDENDEVKESVPTLVGMNVYPADEFDDVQVKQNIAFARKTSATGLATIGDKKKEAEEKGETYNPTDEECALLFTATDLSEEHPIVMSSMFMAFVRSPHYESNMEILINNREGYGTPISAKDFNDLHNALALEDVMEITLSEKLIGFMRDEDTDFTKLTTASDGSQVYVVPLSKIADVESTEEFSSYAYYYGGQMNITKGIIIKIYKTNGANSSAVVEKVKSIYTEMSKEEGFNVEVNLLDDQSEFISDSISNVLVSMLIGGLLAVIIIFIFLKKVKPSIIISVTMPLSVLAALICMYAMGITLNMVSLGGLAVGIGMLVDNSIVVIEAITKHRENGKTAYRAAVDGVCEVGGALIGSTITTVCVFIPIIFSGGLTGEIFTDLSWAVIFSLTFSLIIAVSVIPTLYSLLNGGDKQMLKASATVTPLEELAASAPEESVEKANDEVGSETGNAAGSETSNAVGGEENLRGKGKAKAFFNKLKQPTIMRGIDKVYRMVLPKVLSKKVVTVCAAVVIFAASAFMVTLTGTEFLPSIDKGQIEVNMSYGANAQIDEVQEDVVKFAEAIKENIPNIDYMSVSVGKNGLLALTDTGIITVQLTTNRHTDNVVNDIRSLAKTSGISGTVTVSEVDGVIASLMSGSSGISVSIMGEDADTLSVIAKEITARLEADEADGFTDVKNSLTEKSTQYRLEFDRLAIANYGLDYSTLVTTLRVGIASYTAATAEIDGQSYSLNVQFDGSVFGEDDLPAKDKLADFIVGYDGTTAIHLKDILVKSEESDEYGIIVEKTDACIRRSNGLSTVTITAQNTKLDDGSASDKLHAIAQAVLSEGGYSDYSFKSSGVSAYLDDAFEGLAVALVISFFLLYAVMAIQFSSFLKPIIIMTSIPFCFTGGFLALVITGTSLNVVSFIGLIMLMGVIVNNAIVMLEKIKQLHDEGMPHYTAVQEACYERLRPILMTTLTTILALIPLAIGVGKGSELMQPLGIVVIGGLLIGTLVTLALVPAVYCIFNRLSAQHPNGKKVEKTKE